MLVTVVGLLPHDSGKTRLTARLARQLLASGVEVEAFKPVGGHSVWDGGPGVPYTLRARVLVGNDAVRLGRALGRRPEELQAVDVLLAPPDPLRYAGRLRDYLDASESFARTAVLARVSECAGGGMRHEHYAVVDGPRLAPALERLVSEVASSLEPPPRPVSRAELTALLSRGVAAADSCVRSLASRGRLVLVESYNDVVVPVPAALESALFIAVGPGRAMVYRGGDVVRALRALSATQPGAARAYEVLSLVRPVEAVAVEYARGDDEAGPDVEELASVVARHLDAG